MRYQMWSDFSAVLVYISKTEGHYSVSVVLLAMALSNTSSSSVHSMAAAVFVALLIVSALVSSTYAGTSSNQHACIPLLLS